MNSILPEATVLRDSKTRLEPLLTVSPSFSLSLSLLPHLSLILSHISLNKTILFPKRKDVGLVLSDSEKTYSFSLSFCGVLWLCPHCFTLNSWDRCFGVQRRAVRWEDREENNPDIHILCSRRGTEDPNPKGQPLDIRLQILERLMNQTRGHDDLHPSHLFCSRKRAHWKGQKGG